jgi:hypothetical protein|tara:strand:- start:547 stop:846 length:300 start_codon:yes stop_codon:yes gene_type:complete
VVGQAQSQLGNAFLTNPASQAVATHVFLQNLTSELNICNGLVGGWAAASAINAAGHVISVHVESSATIKAREEAVPASTSACTAEEGQAQVQAAGGATM